MNGRARIQTTIRKNPQLSVNGGEVLERELCMFVPGKDSEGICHPNGLLRDTEPARTLHVQAFICEKGILGELLLPSHCPTLGELR